MFVQRLKTLFSKASKKINRQIDLEIKHQRSLNKKPSWKKINLNSMAKQVTLEEGKKVSISIAQVKEVMKLTFQYLKDVKDDQGIGPIEEVLDRY